MKLYKLFIEFSDLTGKPPVVGEFIAQDDEAAKKVAEAQIFHFINLNPEGKLFLIGEEIDLKNNNN